jgi:hypothetical protein
VSEPFNGWSRFLWTTCFCQIFESPWTSMSYVFTHAIILRTANEYETCLSFEDFNGWSCIFYITFVLIFKNILIKYQILFNMQWFVHECELCWRISMANHLSCFKLVFVNFLSTIYVWILDICNDLQMNMKHVNILVANDASYV